MNPERQLPVSGRNAFGEALRKACSFPAFLGMLLAAAAFVATSWQGTLGGKLFAEGDTWFHVAVGEQILSTRRWPTTDGYSFTAAGQPWTADQWLGGTMMALAERLGGLAGLAGLLVALSVALVWLVYYSAYLRSKDAKAAAVATALVLPILGPFFTLRPQLWGFIFLGVALVILERFRQGGKKVLWLLPVVFLLWVNTHATFVFGVLVLGLYWVSGLVEVARPYLASRRWSREERRRLLIVSLLSGVALAITPYGTKLAAFPLEVAYTSPAFLTKVSEWYAPSLANQPVVEFFAGLFLLFFLLQALFSPLTCRVEEAALLVFFGFEAMTHVRFIPLFGLVVAPLLAAHLSRWVPRYDPASDRHILNAVLMLLIVFGVVKLFPSGPDLARSLAKNYPQGGAEFLRQHPELERTLNDYGWGGYLIWSGRKVFIDGQRAFLYDRAGVFEDYLRIVNLDPNATELLRKYRLHACLIKKDVSFGTFLAALPGWERVYRDEVSEVYVAGARSATTPKSPP